MNAQASWFAPGAAGSSRLDIGRLAALGLIGAMRRLGTRVQPFLAAVSPCRDAGAIGFHADGAAGLLEEMSLVVVIALEHVEGRAAFEDRALDGIAEQQLARAQRSHAGVESALEIVEPVAQPVAVEHGHAAPAEFQLQQTQASACQQGMHQLPVESEIFGRRETGLVGPPSPAQTMQFGQAIEGGIERDIFVRLDDSRPILLLELAPQASHDASTVIAQAPKKRLPVRRQHSVDDPRRLPHPQPGGIAPGRVDERHGERRVGLQVVEVQRIPAGQMLGHMLGESLCDRLEPRRVQQRIEIIGRGVASGADLPQLAYRQNPAQPAFFDIQRQHPKELSAVPGRQNAQLPGLSIVPPPQALPLPGQKDAGGRADRFQVAPAILERVELRNGRDGFDTHVILVKDTGTMRPSLGNLGPYISMRNVLKNNLTHHPLH
ncbi:hypothetical protein THIARS_50061 [Thiomonas delicata]|uniref:Uncharacterized protein n=1 Tax=Thiomonas delicata TaxID=364030 RepID=A0A238D0N3_THIDL|nr:hypothetical protein THIARS_50061 [Thiomonas delicata]